MPMKVKGQSAFPCDQRNRRVKLAFLSVCSSRPLSLDETKALDRSAPVDMVKQTVMQKGGGLRMEGKGKHTAICCSIVLLIAVCRLGER